MQQVNAIGDLPDEIKYLAVYGIDTCFGLAKVYDKQRRNNSQRNIAMTNIVCEVQVYVAQKHDRKYNLHIRFKNQIKQ